MSQMYGIGMHNLIIAVELLPFSSSPVYFCMLLLCLLSSIRFSVMHYVDILFRLVYSLRLIFSTRPIKVLITDPFCCG